MKTPQEIVVALGREVIAERLGVAVRRVDRVKTEKKIPASWYVGLSELHGEDLPRDMFTFK